MSENDVLDYAIVGGGVSGIYSGWRLLEQETPDPRPAVALFESSPRLGGRLLSVIPPKIPSARVELGGMRYIKDTQPWVTALVEHLGLATEALAAAEAQNFCYVRGDHLRMFQLTDWTDVPYALGPYERSEEQLGNLTGVAAMRALKKTIYDLLGKDIRHWTELGTEMTAADWEKVATEGLYDGTPLYELTMQYLMFRQISHEAYLMAQDTSGYDSILHTWNAADGFGWNVGDYGPHVSYLHVTDGYQAVPDMLAEQFKASGGQIHMETRLRSFDFDDESQTVSLEVEWGNSIRTVTARHLILAMPRRSIELLAQTGPVLDPSNDDVHELIESVTPIPLFKLAICYRYPWWEDIAPVDTGDGEPKSITAGKSTTDLPVRQCYYWKVDPDTGKAVILIYDDGVALDYWVGLRDSTQPSFPNDPGELPPDFDLGDWADFPAPKRMVEEVHRQLIELHGVDPADVPEPYSAAYRDWGEDPYGGGANFWPVGVKSFDVGHRVIQPKPPYPVYICGEAYSHAQGWVEGALATAEEMLQGPIGIRPPSWHETEVPGA